MLDQTIVQISGQSYMLTRMEPHEQFEAECILLHLLGPSVASGIGSMIDTFAVELIQFVRETAGVGEDFDLAKLQAIRETIDTKDKIVRETWGRLLKAVETLGSDVLTGMVPALTDRLDFVKVLRLFDLAVLRRVLVIVDGKPQRLEKFSTVAALTRNDPRAKWALLGASLHFNYLNLDEPDVEPTISEVAPE